MKVFLVVLLIVVIIAGVVIAGMIRHGFSTRGEPTRTEEAIARGMRHFATPSSERDRRNPVALNDGVLADARAHWADHCASCHGNDGAGQTEMGRNLYPKAPDMRKSRTQDLTDGELFSIIRNGVRLTGMPAWGDPSGSDDAETWKLVHFIRHLPKITEKELQEMEALNPKSAEEREQMKKEKEFLEGK